MSSAPDMLDTRGLRCPLPVIRLETRLRRMAEGARVRIMADDPIAAIDIPHFARQGGHTCLRLPSEDDKLCVFEVTRGP
ncbi:sulfurtransferase TusA family protein [Parvularcula sp. LCG005]|uniref:sulfurtransferase TusA family protein n=1 Tax=Parvularcula sp. LCG005 TaxID=3078805 RepID=UPI0029420D5C|nr:sulfurtransferase TusA family protein [Parvularcula sp. LCG005]WOI52010.1 sulfurtransferase TusA family protein [Parvularcula sp. LCG005]